MQKSQDFKVGDTVYFDSGCAYIECGIIESLLEHDSKVFAKVKYKITPGVIPRSTIESIDCLYKSEQECQNAIAVFSEKIKDEYRKQIQTVDDLVIFLFNHDTDDCEMGDNEARAVAIEMAQKLMGMSETKLLGMEPEIR